MDSVPAAWGEHVIARIVSQGAKRREDSDAESFLAFSLEINGKTLVFTIPRPLVNGGYTLAQLNQIEIQLAYFGLELLPIDSNQRY